ncbi:DUF979 domain-containing protein [Pacificimonas sp. WHA3]|uniref:DUF979 domain-containing protein n=1 Tax=Pacificimonas pallii TaxID=2827236 RepID=A0ABS6SH51_9SPHN|nr:DUF979 domain-containing protein [Pacificimonas pallii]MBV7257749.1 DUF979 domain-containing protein [Pacificimonas pallii]
MITLGFVYIVTGLFFAVTALLSAADRSNQKRFGNAAFWGLLALSFLAGDRLGDLGNGMLVICLVAIAGFGQLGQGSGRTTDAAARAAEALKRGAKLFLPALVIPAVALGGTLLFKWREGIAQQGQETIVALCLGTIIALLCGYIWLKPKPMIPLQEGRRLMDAVGWAAVLPQMLASLGAVFALAGVGDVVGGIAGVAIPDGSLFGAVLVYALGMALFTMIMGNAFAAFPVMTAAVGLPLLIRTYDGDPAIVCAIGMLSGFCGTLMTPMAANFNIVPAALLDLKDRNGVIRQQIGTAIPLLGVNVLLIWWLAF